LLPVILIYMNIKTTAIILFSSLIASPVFAMDYPQFGGITLNSDTTAAQYIIYFFNLALAIGAFIAVIMVISAGIEWVTSGGEPGKVSSAKAKIINTLFGVFVLLGCYFILYTINPELTNIKINDLNCENGIVLNVTKTVGGKVQEKCIDSNHSNIEDIIVSTKKWNFPEKYLLKVYAYTGADYSGTATEIKCDEVCSGDIPIGTKSIYFVQNRPGIYLYDVADLKVGVKSYPRFTSSSAADLTQLNSFDNYTQSIDIVNPDQAEEEIQYQAVVFESQNWRGRCAFIGQPLRSLDQGISGYYTDKVSNISSVIVAKANLDQSVVNEDRGKVILYTKTNCGKSGASDEIKSCVIPIGNAASGQININEQCKNTNIDPVTGKEIGFVDGDEVMSFEITGAAGLVLSTSKYGQGNSKTYCQYFNKNDLGGGTCLSIVGTSIFTVGGETPKSFIIIPDN
jgi:hypothetical protein